MIPTSIPVDFGPGITDPGGAAIKKQTRQTKQPHQISKIFFFYIFFYLTPSFGAMVGTGAGLAFPPTVYIVTSYFVRLRGLANGICMSGSAFGSIILPPALRYLLETYGYK